MATGPSGIYTWRLQGAREAGPLICVSEFITVFNLKYPIRHLESADAHTNSVIKNMKPARGLVPTTAKAPSGACKTRLQARKFS